MYLHITIHIQDILWPGIPANHSRHTGYDIVIHFTEKFENLNSQTMPYIYTPPTENNTKTEEEKQK